MKAQISKYQERYRPAAGDTSGRSREELILKYAPLVRYIAERMAMRLPPSVSKDDLASAGILGLFDAIDKFDPERGVKFRTYAEHRIRGAILDELRKMDWVLRSVRRDVHRIEDAIRALESKFGRPPRDFEIAEYMGLDIEAYHRMLQKARGVNLLSLDETLPDGSLSRFRNRASEDVSPLDELKIKELKKVIAGAISTLSEKEQLVVSLYYYDELTLREIGEVLDLTESRISQIHTKAIIRLRAKLQTYYDLL